MSAQQPTSDQGGAIILAAGFGRRFGSDKRRHALADGTPLLIASLQTYAAAFANVLLVLRPEDRDLAREVTAAPWAERVRVVFCADAHLGMGHSLGCGARAAADAHWPWLFVALADMAWVRPDTLEMLREALAGAVGATIVQPRHDGRPGHPVGFSADYLPRLSALTGDAGARQLVSTAGAELLRLTVDDPGVLQDLDVPPGEPAPGRSIPPAN